jgi:hypothetical protein
MSAKGVKRTFMNGFWYGDSSVSSKTFDGVHRMFLTGGESSAELTAQSFHIGSGSTGDALALADMDLALDAVRDGKPTCMVTTRNVRRRVTQYLRTVAATGGRLHQGRLRQHDPDLGRDQAVRR